MMGKKNPFLKGTLPVKELPLFWQGLIAPRSLESYFILFYFFKYFIYLFMRDTEREREAETQAEGEAGSMQGARCGTRTRDSRIAPWAKGRH